MKENTNLHTGIQVEWYTVVSEGRVTRRRTVADRCRRRWGE